MALFHTPPRPPPFPFTPFPVHRILLLFRIVIFGGPAIELAGYGSLAFYWYTACGISILLVAFLMILQRWLAGEKTPPEEKEPVSPAKWIGLRLLRLAIYGAAFYSIMTVWGLQDRLVGPLQAVIGYQLEIGNIRISPRRLLLTLLSLVVTHFVARSLRGLLLGNLLKDSGLEQGVRASISTLATYLTWVVGILVTFRVMGINTTSIAVGFGAIGIGLGFGLQNIFNNFFSGLILLFERPIQEGDIIDIEGVKGSVRQINFRSTIVQTFNNVSLIIPNAEFINSRVENWSFKDKRVRDRIRIGVAYGSDVKKVEGLLLAAARETPWVLKHPAPEVLFRNFGDSALDFELRFWTTVPYYGIIDTRIRFAILEKFREHAIEIPFPQQDLHVKSGLPPERSDLPS